MMITFDMHINFQILKISYFSQRLVYRSSQVYRAAQARNTATRPKFSESKEFLCIVMTCDSKWAKWAPSLYLSSLSLSLSFSLTHQHTQFIDFIPTISPALRHAWEITERFFFVMRMEITMETSQLNYMVGSQTKPHLYTMYSYWFSFMLTAWTIAE